MTATFTVGSVHENREGKFEVLAVGGADMTVRVNGKTKTYNIAIQAKICENVAADRQRMAMTLGLNDMAWLAGAMASHCRFQMNIHTKQYNSIRNQYEKLTGDELPADRVYVRGGETWGSELQVHVPMDVATHPRFTVPNGITPTEASGGCGLIISNNTFFWHLVKTFGLKAANQNLAEIEATLPEDVRADFRAGCALS